MCNKFYLIIYLGLVFLSASSLAMVSFKAADEKLQSPINRLESYEAYKPVFPILNANIA